MSEPKSRRELALLASGGLVAAAVATTYAPPAAAMDQPAMQRARAALDEAYHFLEIAAENKGGYRAAAMKSVREAIAQVDAGIAFADTHR